MLGPLLDQKDAPTKEVGTWNDVPLCKPPLKSSAVDTEVKCLPPPSSKLAAFSAYNPKSGAAASLVLIEEKRKQKAGVQMKSCGEGRGHKWPRRAKSWGFGTKQQSTIRTVFVGYD